MLSIGKFPTQVQYNPLIHNPVIAQQHLQFPSKTHLSFSNPLDFHAVVGKLQNGFCCNASKTKKKGNFSVKEIDVADEIEDDFDDEFLDLEDDDDDAEFAGDEDDDDDDDEVFVPLENMKKWLKSRPSGFGEGKVYDTSVEDKLVEELEQSRKAQLANLNKLKNGSVKPSPMAELSNLDKGSTHIQDGFRVRLVNLPKKKNIHRDLQLAFKCTPGLLNIVPVVSGNEKTRDPVCKGIAFIDFKYQDEAQRFVENFSGKSISFGKVQKPITCEMVNTNSSKKSASAKSVDESIHSPKKSVSAKSVDESNHSAKESASAKSVDGSNHSPKKSASAKSVDESNHSSKKSASAKSVDESNHSPKKSASAKSVDESIHSPKKSASAKSVDESNHSLKKSVSAKSVDGSNHTPRKAVVKLSKELDAVLDTDVPLLDSLEETVPFELDGEISATSASSDSYIAEDFDVGDDDSVVDSSSSKKMSKVEKSEKKAASKTKKDKVPKTKNILGSASRLKVRDKAMLTGVLSKYGAKAASTVKELTR